MSEKIKPGMLVRMRPRNGDYMYTLYKPDLSYPLEELYKTVGFIEYWDDDPPLLFLKTLKNNILLFLYGKQLLICNSEDKTIDWFFRPAKLEDYKKSC